jgi:hypothetical protein
MQKISDTELQRIQLIKKDALEIASSLGELQYQRISIDLLIEEESKKIAELKKSEKRLFEELRDIYGSVNINIETGEFK